APPGYTLSHPPEPLRQTWGGREVDFQPRTAGEALLAIVYDEGSWVKDFEGDWRAWWRGNRHLYLSRDGKASDVQDEPRRQP
ncbi:MAG: hypothetical protein PHU21_14910, partial [Elusimicrobia bacterium]|nr:hypothetical protein [Elusimicrobiota bacterium]